MSVAFFSLRNLVKRNLSLLLAALFVLVAASALQAQIVETGVITGVVKDNTGAVIPGAHVAVRNTGTGLTTLTSTDAQGIYVTPPLHPGDYTVQIEVAGFSKVVESVRLEVGQRVAADANLAVGTARRDHRGPGLRRTAGDGKLQRRQSPHRRSRQGSASERPQLQ